MRAEYSDASDSLEETEERGVMMAMVKDLEEGKEQVQSQKTRTLNVVMKRLCGLPSLEFQLIIQFVRCRAFGRARVTQPQGGQTFCKELGYALLRSSSHTCTDLTARLPQGEYVIDVGEFTNSHPSKRCKHF